jgi:hypothetical protein
MRCWCGLGVVSGTLTEGATGVKDDNFDIERLARRRQEFWLRLARWAEVWPEGAYQARGITETLNGHAYDGTRGGGKSSYFDGNTGGLYGDRRQDKAEASKGGAFPDPEFDALDALIRANGDCRGGGRRKGWKPGSKRGQGDHARRKAGEVKWYDLGDPEAAEVLGAEVERRGGHVVGVHDLAGGDHDRVYLLYDKLKPRFPLEEHHVALTRHGICPAEWRGARLDAERIAQALSDAGIAKALIARYFGCSRKTITRITESVPHSPYLERGPDFMGALLQERLDEQDKTLRRIEQTLAAIVETLFVNRVPAAVFGDVIDTLWPPSQLSEAA